MKKPFNPLIYSEIKMDLQEVGGVVETGWSWLRWRALVGTVRDFRVP
jgi:hypothetical protein